MRHTSTPEIFADVLLLAKKADCLGYDRNLDSISLTLDDFAADRRTCVEVRLKELRATVRTLDGYNTEKHRWGGYCQPSRLVIFGSKRGLKALREWLAGAASEATGYPNPASFSIYKKPAS